MSAPAGWYPDPSDPTRQRWWDGARWAAPAAPVAPAPQVAGEWSRVARARSAEAQSRVQEAIGSMDVMDPTSEIGRFEEKIRREEAKVMGQQELAASSLDAQFESLEDLSQESEVEARFAALKAGRTTDHLSSLPAPQQIGEIEH